MLYIPMSSPTAAENLSKLLYQLSRPLTVRQPNDVTFYYCEWVTLSNSNVLILPTTFLILPETETINVNLATLNTLLDEVLQPFVVLGAISSTVIQDTRNKITVNLGKPVVIYDLLPDYWKNKALTKEQLAANGWITTVAALPIKF